MRLNREKTFLGASEIHHFNPLRQVACGVKMVEEFTSSSLERGTVTKRLMIAFAEGFDSGL
jgi:hypothetical protein